MIDLTDVVIDNPRIMFVRGESKYARLGVYLDRQFKFSVHYLICPSGIKNNKIFHLEYLFNLVTLFIVDSSARNKFGQKDYQNISNECYEILINGTSYQEYCKEQIKGAMDVINKLIVYYDLGIIINPHF